MSTSLEDLLPLPVGVNIGRGEISLHGIYLEDLTRLLLVHKDQLLGFLGSGTTVNLDLLAIAAPAMVIDIIAAASDNQERRPLVARIPLASQLECLGVIYRLSVPDEKKFSELLEVLVEKVKEARVVLAKANRTSDLAITSP